MNPSGEQFGVDLVINITQRDRTVVGNLLRVSDLRDKADMRVVDGVRERFPMKESLHFFDDVRPDRSLMSMEESR